MSSPNESNKSAFANLPLFSKSAAVLFIVAKVHGLFGVLTMFVHRPLAAFLLAIACLALVSSAVLALVQMLKIEAPRTLEERLAWHRSEAQRIETMLND